MIARERIDLPLITRHNILKGKWVEISIYSGCADMEAMGGLEAGSGSFGLFFEPVQAVGNFLKEAFLDFVKRVLPRDAGIMQVGIRDGPAHGNFPQGFILGVLQGHCQNRRIKTGLVLLPGPGQGFILQMADRP